MTSNNKILYFILLKRLNAVMIINTKEKQSANV
jgi:hypothetical protein